jgi:Mn-dependent DtxR family transcriptional regulator
MHLYALSLQHEDEPGHGHSVAVLRTMSQHDADVDGALSRLADRGLARRTEAGLWAPSELGRREARKILERELEDGP